MTNELDDYDDFREANLLLTTTLKQLDDVISKGAATGSLYRLYSDSRTSVHSAMNGNDYDNRSSSTPHRSTSISSTSGNGIRISGHSVDTHNNSSDINGNGSSDFADGSQMIPMTNGHSTVSHLSNVPQTKAPIQWNMSVSNWIDHASKVTPESSGSVSPDSFGVDESPPSDALNSSSGNGLDDPMPEPICQPPPSPVGRLLEAIDGNRLNSPLDSSSKIKILQWINKLQDPQNLALDERVADRSYSVPCFVLCAAAASQLAVMGSFIPATVDELMRTCPNSELGQSVTSVDSNHSGGLRNSLSNGNILAKESRSMIPRSSSIVTTCSSSRPILPYVTHYSDSGFSSTLSSGSSCSYLPPPPPYRVRSGTTNSDGGPDRSSLAAVVAEGFNRRQQRRIQRSLSDSRYGVPVTSSSLLARPDAQFNDKWQQKSPSPSMSTVSCPEYPELQDKLHKLAMARDSLSLQVTVLNEQVGTQREKIRDLESLLATKRKTFAYDSVCENTTEAQKTDLINEINMLKNKYALLEKDKVAAERRLQMSQAEIDRLSQTMHQIVTQHGIQLHHPHGGSSAAAAANDHNIEMEQLRITVQRLIADNEQKSIEINSLRNALDEHSRAIENYGLGSQRSSFGQVPPPAPQPQSFNINAQLRKLLVDDSKENIAHSNSFPVSLCSSGQQSSAYGSMSSRTPIPSTSYTSSLSMASPQPSSWSSGISAAPRNIHHTNSLIGPSASFGPNMSNSSNFRSPSSPAARQLAAELDELRRINGELSLQQQSNQPYSTNSLPRHLPINGKNGTTLTLPLPKLSIGSSGANGSVNGESGSKRATSPSHSSSSSYSRPNGSRFGGSSNRINKWIHDKLLGGASRRKRGPPTSASTRPNAWKLGHVYDEPGNNESRSRAVTKRSTSAPNLGPRGIHALMSEDYLTSRCSDVEIESDDEILRNGQPSATQSTSNFKRGRTRSTLRNFLGKLTRSTSQEIPTGAFRRGSGVRASASARLATIAAPVAGAIAIRPPVQQFVDWNTEQICEWFAEIGFTQYVPEAERYVRSGRHLLNMSDNELEKELVIKNPLHRKRLKCILDCIDKNATGPADRMDVHQVLLWLDMIGVPQFREAFSENLIDGQMLLCLTAQDLIDMKITSALNHATLARGIQFLHSVDFHLHRLEKVFNNEVMLKLPIANEVEKWAHACVSHWLKSIDLAEFTPNLIFSGIHGALMVHEPTFTAESLAEVLQIPAHKTLLRRHLTTQFNNLLGQEVISRKRETLAQPFVTFLSPTLRVKLVKKGFSLSRKKNKNEVYVEPHVPVYSPRARQYYGTSTLTATDI